MVIRVSGSINTRDFKLVRTSPTLAFQLKDKGAKGKQFFLPIPKAKELGLRGLRYKKTTSCKTSAINTISTLPFFTSSLRSLTIFRCREAAVNGNYVQPDYSPLRQIIYDHSNSPPHELFIGDLSHLTFDQLLTLSKSLYFKKQILNALSSPYGFGYAQLPLMTQEQYKEFGFNLFGPLTNDQFYGEDSSNHPDSYPFHTDFNSSTSMFYYGKYPRLDLGNTLTALFFPNVESSLGGALCIHHTPKEIERLQKYWASFAKDNNCFNQFLYFRQPDCIRDCVRSKKSDKSLAPIIRPLLAPFGWGGLSTLQFRERVDVHPNALLAYQDLIDSIANPQNHSILDIKKNGTWVVIRGGGVHGREAFQGIREIWSALYNNTAPEYRIPTFIG